jgi:hypothetical protein
LPQHLLREMGVPNLAGTKTGAIIGNIWGRRWLELLRHTVRESGISISWYYNGDQGTLPCTREELLADGIKLEDALPDAPLIEKLRQVLFTVVPSGLLDDSDDRRWIAKLSLPSRIPYTLATSHAPIIVLGSPDTAAARFVLRERIGLVCPYERSAFQAAVQRITDPVHNLAYRKAALAAAPRFVDRDTAGWIWESLALGQPVDRRFEDAGGDIR